MKSLHKRVAWAIFLLVLGCGYVFNIHLTEGVCKSLVTFFAVMCGFYMTCMAIMCSSSYIGRLYDELASNDQTRRKIDVLKDYFLIVSKFAIASITIVIIYMLYTAKGGDYLINNLGVNVCIIDINLLISNFVIGISAVNIYFMLLFLNTIGEEIIQQAKDKKQDPS